MNEWIKKMNIYILEMKETKKQDPKRESRQRVGAVEGVWRFFLFHKDTCSMRSGLHIHDIQFHLSLIIFLKVLSLIRGVRAGHSSIITDPMVHRWIITGGELKLMRIFISGKIKWKLGQVYSFALTKTSIVFSCYRLT